MKTYQKELLSKSSINAKGDISIKDEIDFNTHLDCSEKVAVFLRAIWNRNLINEQEEVYAVFVDNQNTIITYKHLFKGGLTKCSFDNRILFKYALMCNATGVFIAHNHPGGTLKASKEDKELTYEIKFLAGKLGIRFLDHIILTSDSYFSFDKAMLL